MNTLLEIIKALAGVLFAIVCIVVAIILVAFIIERVRIAAHEIAARYNRRAIEWILRWLGRVGE